MRNALVDAGELPHMGVEIARSIGLPRARCSNPIGQGGWPVGAITNHRASVVRPIGIVARDAIRGLHVATTCLREQIGQTIAKQIIGRGRILIVESRSQRCFDQTHASVRGIGLHKFEHRQVVQAVI